MADNKVNLSKALEELEAIADWFDDQEAVDVEEGLTKVKQAAKLIKGSKARLAEIENEFQEIEKEIADESDEVLSEGPIAAKEDKEEIATEKINIDEIPF
jgi:hypothetical protein